MQQYTGARFQRHDRVLCGFLKESLKQAPRGVKLYGGRKVSPSLTAVPRSLSRKLNGFGAANPLG